MEIVISQSRKIRHLFRQRWHFVIVQPSNGQVVATSENYVNRGDCLATARSIAGTTSWKVITPEYSLQAA